MNIITPNFILTPTKLLNSQAIAFDKTIHKIAPFDELKREYPDANIINLQKNSLLMPGLINAHVHLEFSSNKTTLKYGSFLPWLYSVIKHREELSNECDDLCIKKAIDLMLKNGITTFGTISSYGFDLQACANAKQNVIYFNELIGSDASMADILFKNFLSRLDASKELQRDGFYPSIALHSPYSLHPILIKKALDIAKNESLRTTAHFMESIAEREWLDSSSGEFSKFFEDFFKRKNTLLSSKEFLEYFDGKKTSFAHSIHTKDEELEKFRQNNHSILHCPISNRLLGNGVLDLTKLKDINLVVATDGLSSNYTLDLFEELKIALFMHKDANLLELAKELILSITLNAAKALEINSGEIAVGKNADMIVLDLDAPPNEDVALHLILHRYNISKVFIRGEI